MEFKRVLLASSALALFAGAQEAQAGDLYLSVFGGANFLKDSSGFVSSGAPFTTLAINADSDTGFVLGGAIGARLENWAKGLSAELEVSYRRHDIGGTGSFGSYFTGTGSGVLDMNQSTFAIMANAQYEFNVGSKARPYIMAGVGWARSKVDGAIVGTETQATFTDEHNGFAWQLGAGFNYEVQPGVDLGVGYRYLEGPDNDIFFNGKIATLSQKIENKNHSVMVNLKINID